MVRRFVASWTAWAGGTGAVLLLLGIPASQAIWATERNQATTRPGHVVSSPAVDDLPQPLPALLEMAATIPSQVGVTQRRHGRHDDGEDDDSARDRDCRRRHYGWWCPPRCPYTDRLTWLYLGSDRSYLVYGSGPIMPYPHTYPHYYFPGTYVPPTSIVPVYGTPGLHRPVQAIAYPGSVPLEARAGVPRQWPQPLPDPDGANLEEAEQREWDRAGQRAAEAEEEGRHEQDGDEAKTGAGGAEGRCHGQAARGYPGNETGGSEDPGQGPTQ